MAQKRYAVACNGAAAAAPMPVGYIGCTAAQRARIYEFMVGPSPTAPADQAVQLTIKRTTAAPTGGSAVTPAPLDANEVAAVCSARSADTTEATFGTTLFQFGLNIRGTYRWVAAPDCEFMGTAGAATGLELSKTAESTANVQEYGCLMFFE